MYRYSLVWKITKSKDIPLSLRDRVVCTVAAEAVQALCETGLDGASLVGGGTYTQCACECVHVSVCV